MTEPQSEINKVSALPTISQETRDRMVEEMAVNSPDHSKKTEKIDSIALSILTDVADVQPQLLQGFKNAIVSEGAAEEYSLTNYARGIALVLRAFHLQSDYRLIPDLGRLKSEDISAIQSRFLERLKAFGGGRNMFDEALYAPRIPASQSFLREIIEEPAKTNSVAFEHRYRAGAGLMYDAMDLLWDKLYPGQNQITSQPTVSPESNLSDPPQPPTQSSGPQTY